MNSILNCSMRMAFIHILILVMLKKLKFLEKIFLQSSRISLPTDVLDEQQIIGIFVIILEKVPIK